MLMFENFVDSQVTGFSLLHNSHHFSNKRTCIGRKNRIVFVALSVEADSPGQSASEAESQTG